MEFTVCTDPAALGFYYTFGDGKPQPRPLRFLPGAGASVVALDSSEGFMPGPLSLTTIMSILSADVISKLTSVSLFPWVKELRMRFWKALAISFSSNEK